MTREETIKWLESLRAEIGKSEHRALWHYAEAIDIAIKALQIDIVQCKDCKYMKEHYDTNENVPYWTCPEWDGETDADGFCHRGERK